MEINSGEKICKAIAEQINLDYLNAVITIQIKRQFKSKDPTFGGLKKNLNIHRSEICLLVILFIYANRENAFPISDPDGLAGNGCAANSGLQAQAKIP